MSIQTYPQMNETIKDYFSKSDEFQEQYALAMIVELEKQNARLREVLEFYARVGNNRWEFEGYVWASEVMKDGGDKARKALEEST